MIARAVGTLQRVPATTESLAWERQLGATPVDEGLVEFRVWALGADHVRVRVGGREHALVAAGGGVHEARVDARAGEDYVYLFGGHELPDPSSRHQPRGLRGPSRVVDPRAFAWTDDDFAPAVLADQVIYELHVGTFTPAGTFEAAIEHLPQLARLGVTSIEVMPVAEFPGDHGWGYDGVYLSAAQSTYGGPDGFQRLVDGAHAAGLGVILDVVYNHVGASGNTALAAFGPYFTDRYGTFWGKAINYDDEHCDPVREWVLQSATGWLRDFHVDGLRLDAIHAIYDMSANPLMAELADRVHAARPGALVIAESGLNDPKVIRPRARGGFGHDTQWADDFHHALRVLLTGDTDGYYAEFGAVADLAKAYERPFVHDGQYSSFRTRRPATACRSSSSSSTRTTIRSATARSATACPTTRGRWRRSARCCRRSSRCCSWARSTASPRRFSSSATTSTRRSPRRRARGAGGSSPRSRSSPVRRCPIRRTARRSSARSSRASATPRSPTSMPSCCAYGCNCRAARSSPATTRTPAG
jgi:1,4-alpha-glucan branching enzyme